MRGSRVFVAIAALVLSGCGATPNPFGQLIPDPDNPGQVIKEPPAPIEVTGKGIIVPPTAPVRTYKGGRG